jgi:hyaluronan synthase
VGGELGTGRVGTRARNALVLGAISVTWLGLVAWRLNGMHTPTLAVAALIGSIWLLLRMAFAAGNRPVVTTSLWDDALSHLRVAIVVPIYNEDPAYFARCIASFTRQTRLPDAVWLVDDGSPDDRCLQLAREYARASHPFEVHVVRATENGGKRHAQAYAFRDASADIWLTCDSDTILAPEAIEEGLKPFSDRRVAAVAGMTIGQNWRRNLLTRMQDIEFVNGFLIGRAAASRFGSVIVTSGALAFYRSKVVAEHLDDYLAETFLGRKVRAGDDRRLTQYALLHGRVVFQQTAIAYTALPERFRHFVRQRLRWSSSFYRGTVWTAQNLSMKRAAYWLVALQLVELAFVVVTLVTLALTWSHVALVAMLAYLTYMTVLAYVRSIRYLTFGRVDMSMRDKVTSVALAPLISLMYTFVLHPVRIWALAKVCDSGWGGRKQVEVSIDEAVPVGASPIRTVPTTAG